MKFLTTRLQNYEKIWSHPPESNRRPTDYETHQAKNSDLEKPATPKHFGSLILGRLFQNACRSVFSDSSSRTKDGHFSAAKVRGQSIKLFENDCFLLGSLKMRAVVYRAMSRGHD
jgi:hypothetical protein